MQEKFEYIYNEEGVDALDRYLRTMSEPIGAWCNIRYPEEQEAVRRYFSFGEDEGEGKPDKFGVPDIDIFFFAPEGESLIKDWANSGTRDYLIDSYELAYKTI